MAVPNHFPIVQGVYNRGGWDTASEAGIGRFTEACAVELHAADARWGHLRKNPGQTQYNGHAVNAVLYLSDTPGQSTAVDIMRMQMPQPGLLRWLVDVPRYSATDWIKPVGGGPIAHSCLLVPSLFWGLGGERHSWSELNQQLQEYKDAKCDGVRTFVHLNSGQPQSPWNRIGASVHDADLESLIQRYSDRVASFGMRVGWVLTGDLIGMETEDLQSRLCERVGRALDARRAHVLWVEMMNEYVVNGGTTHILRHMYRRSRAAFGSDVLMSLSSPNSVMGGSPSQAEIDAEVYKMYGGLTGKLAITPHWSRTPGHPELHVPPNLGPHAPSVVICNEPRGPKSSVIDSHDPAVLVGDYQAAANRLYFAYVPHSDSGVWSIYIDDEYKIPGERGQWALFTNHKNGPAILEGLKQFRLTGSGGGGVPVPEPEPSPDKLLAGHVLSPGMSLISPNSKHSLQNQPDGNLVLYEGGVGPIWATNTTSPQPGNLKLQEDGNLVLSDAVGTPLWASHTEGHPMSMIQLQDDANLVMYDTSGTPVWASRG